jgi:hypothetical protein
MKIKQDKIENALSEIMRADGRTDRVDNHAYAYFYGPLLRHKQETARNVLEIGVMAGGGVDSWARLFPKAIIHGIDIISKEDAARISGARLPLPSSPSNVSLHRGDGYDRHFLSKFDNVKWDVVIDDGPHTLESQSHTLNYFYTRLAPEGIILVEDVREENIQGVVDSFEGPLKNLSVINRKHTAAVTPWNDEYILMYME